MSSTLHYTELKDINVNKRKNRTYKKKTPPPPPCPPAGKTKQVEEFLNSMDDSEDNLANFNPLEAENMSISTNSSGLPDNISTENYYKQYIPYYTAEASTTKDVSKDELLEKLNYMVHLLEEQKDEKTDNVTEELVLYLFLGVFIIFVTDSFARAGKYAR